jgi:hypothetical protein
MPIGQLKIYNMEKINRLFLPINFILKRFNYLLHYQRMYSIDINFISKIDNEYISIIKTSKIDNTNYYNIVKEYIIWKKNYGLSNCKK